MAIVNQKSRKFKGELVTKAKNGGKRKQRGTSGGCDAIAEAHRKLLLNPCGAPLAQPVYGGGRAGYLVRVVQTFDVATNPTDDFFSVKWAPGLPREKIRTMQPSGVGGVDGPLENSGLPAKEARCVAACLQAYYVGKEINRSGWGVAGNYITDTRAYRNNTTSNLDFPNDQLLQYRASHPESLEAKWFPSTNDTLFSSCANTEPGAGTDQLGRTALGLALTGMADGVATPYRIVAVGVYEWLPDMRRGLQAPTMRAGYSTSTLVDVMRAVSATAHLLSGPVTHMLMGT